MIIPYSKCKQTLSESIPVDVGGKSYDVPDMLNSVLQVDGFKMLVPDYWYQRCHF